jgi:hypothetical protein
MPTSTIAQEVNAAAGAVGTSYRLVLGPGPGAVRVNHAPSRTATLQNLGPGLIRTATVDNAGAYGTFADIASGATQTVTTADRLFVLEATEAVTAITVAIT